MSQPADRRDEILRALNEVLTGELTAINQYFLHAKMLQDWGLVRLAKQVRMESIDEMKHAEQLIDRILFLKGVPNLQRLGRLRIGQTVREQFTSDLAMEDEAIPRLNHGIALCHEAGDHGTRVLLDSILVAEEEHKNWLETQLGLMDRVGEQAYLAEQITG
jgi:bacterioferritin